MEGGETLRRDREEDRRVGLKRVVGRNKRKRDGSGEERGCSWRFMTGVKQ